MKGVTQRRGGAEEVNSITGKVIECAIEIHRNLGPGLLESVYEAILARKLTQYGFFVQRQVVVPIRYEEMTFDEGFRADLIINSLVCIELKSVEALAPVHSKQLLTYLKLLNLEVGLVINFGAPTIKEGLHRIVNGFKDSSSPRLRASA
jgi:iron complex transport system substrate-binding protein